MTDFKHTLSALLSRYEQSAPTGLHAQCLQKTRVAVAWQRAHKIAVFLISVGVSLTAIYSAFHIWIRALETDAVSFVRVAFESMIVDVQSLAYFADMTFEFLPQTWSVVFGIDVLFGCALLVWELWYHSQRESLLS